MFNVDYIIKSNKIVTASDFQGTIKNGAMVIGGGKIKDINQFSVIIKKYKDLKVFDFEDYIITPSLVDCHTHVLEYAPNSIFPVTKHTHLMGGISLLLNVLSSGITSLGEQICGHPETDFGKSDFLKAIDGLPMDITFSISTISIGMEDMPHFSGITGSNPINKEMLIDDILIEQLVKLSDYPGENIMINSSPANLEEKYVPRAGEIVYTQADVNKIVDEFHKNNKRIGAHVAGEEAIGMAIEAGFDILHHAHEISDSQILEARYKDILIVTTPLGGTHLAPNKPIEIVNMVSKGVTVAISTDAYLPPSSRAPWLPFQNSSLVGPDSLMLLSNPSMIILKELGLDENQILQLITLNPAKVLGKGSNFGSLEKGKDANFLVAKGIPGLEITDPNDIIKVFFKGLNVIDKS